MEERDFTHQYYVVEREDYKDAEAFQDFNPEGYKKNFYTAQAEASFSVRGRRFLQSLQRCLQCETKHDRCFNLRGRSSSLHWRS